MRRLLFTLLMSLFPGAAHAAGHGFACDLRTMTKEERGEHAELTRRLRSAVEERRELPNGYAFRLPSEHWLPAARWAELERKCCPFLAFELNAAAEHGPLWLRITGRSGAKTFMKEELGW